MKFPSIPPINLLQVANGQNAQNIVASENLNGNLNLGQFGVKGGNTTSIANVGFSFADITQDTFGFGQIVNSNPNSLTKATISNGADHRFSSLGRVEGSWNNVGNAAVEAFGGLKANVNGVGTLSYGAKNVTDIKVGEGGVGFLRGWTQNGHASITNSVMTHDKNGNDVKGYNDVRKADNLVSDGSYNVDLFTQGDNVFKSRNSGGQAVLGGKNVYAAFEKSGAKVDVAGREETVITAKNSSLDINQLAGNKNSLSAQKSHITANQLANHENIAALQDSTAKISQLGSYNQITGLNSKIEAQQLGDVNQIAVTNSQLTASQFGNFNRVDISAWL